MRNEQTTKAQTPPALSPRVTVASLLAVATGLGMPAALVAGRRPIVARDADGVRGLTYSLTDGVVSVRLDDGRVSVRHLNHWGALLGAWGAN